MNISHRLDDNSGDPGSEAARHYAHQLESWKCIREPFAFVETTEGIAFIDIKALLTRAKVAEVWDPATR